MRTATVRHSHEAAAFFCDPSRKRMSKEKDGKTGRARGLVIASPQGVPQHGGFVWMNFDPQAGHEQSGQRLALVFSLSAHHR
jgi:hypothetical protein